MCAKIMRGAESKFRKKGGYKVEQERDIANLVLFLCTTLGKNINGGLASANGNFVTLWLARPCAILESSECESSLEIFNRNFFSDPHNNSQMRIVTSILSVFYDSNCPTFCLTLRAYVRVLMGCSNLSSSPSPIQGLTCA